MSNWLNARLSRLHALVMMMLHRKTNIWGLVNNDINTFTELHNLRDMLDILIFYLSAIKRSNKWFISILRIIRYSTWYKLDLNIFRRCNLTIGKFSNYLVRYKQNIKFHKCFFLFVRFDFNMLVKVNCFQYVLDDMLFPYYWFPIFVKCHGSCVYKWICLQSLFKYLSYKNTFLSTS